MAGGNSNITVSIGADVADLQAKSALAQNVLNKLNGELRNVANQMRTASDAGKAALLPVFQQIATQTAAARVEAGRYSSELSKQIKAINEAGDAHQKNAGFVAQNRVALGELEHSVRAVADGFAAGIDPERLFGMEALRIVQALTEFQTVSAGTIAAFTTIGAVVLGAAGALAYFGSEMERRRDDANNLQAILAARNVNIGQDAIADAETHLRDYGDVSQKVADQIVSTFGKMRGATVESVTALTDIVPYFAKVMQSDIPEAATKMVTALGDVRGEGAKFLASLNASKKVQDDFQDSLKKPMAQPTRSF